MTLTKTHKAYFEIAKAVAKLSDFPRIKIGAVAVYKHHVVSSGFNTQRTAPIQKKYNKYRFTEDNSRTQHAVHAEVACLKPLLGRGDINFKDISLYVYREYKDGSLALARPCSSCYRFICDLGIRNIYYSTSIGFSHEVILEDTKE